MFASKSRPSAWWIGMSALMCLAAHNPLHAQDNALQQLEELKRALQQPNAGTVDSPPPRRTRAIVFDSDSSTNKASTASPSPQAQSPSAATSTEVAPPQVMQDCKTKVAAQEGSDGGKSVPFSIQFAGGSAEISPVSRELLGNIGGLLTSMLNGRCVVIEGHTDVSGNYERNVELSRARANSVASFLMQNHNIPSRHVVTFGKGPSEILPGVDPKNPKNRRVVFRIVG